MALRVLGSTGTPAVRGCLAAIGVLGLAGLAWAGDKVAPTAPAIESLLSDSGLPGGNAVVQFLPRGPGNGCNVASNQCQERTTLTINDPRASNSSFTGGFAVADNFQPAAAGNLTSICFWGYYGPASVNGTPPVAGSEGFRIRIYTNSQGVPATLIGEYLVGTNFTNGSTPTVGTSLTRSGSLGTATGAAVPVPNPDLFAFTATIPDLAVTSQCYWLEISAGSVGSVDQRFRWVEATNAGGPNDLVTLQTPANPGTYSFNNIINSFDRAFCLGFSAPTALAVPSCGVPPPAPNNSCANATAVSTLPFSAVGGTFRSAFSAVPYCGSNPVNAPAVFYRVVGTGATLTASTCGTTTDFDTVLNVYCSTVSTGTGAQICGTGNANLRCVANNDTGPTTCAGGGAAADPSQVSWASVAGQTYLVVLFGFESAIGSFDFSLSSDGVPSGATGACSSDRCPLDNSAITLSEIDTCGTGTASTNSACTGTGVGRFLLGQQFKGISSNAPVTTAAGGTRDFDFWEYDEVNGGPLPDNTDGRGFTVLRVSYQAEFPGVLNFFSGACDAANGAFLGGAFTFYTAFGSPPACQERSIIVQLTPGQPFRLNILPVDFGGIPCAAGNNNYRIRVSLEPTRACCVAGPACVVTSSLDCTSLGGTFSATATSCTPDPCSAPTTQVCCRGVTCAIIDPALCIAPPGIGISTFSGTTCAGQSAIFAGCCYADFNKSGVKDVADIFAFLSAWFANSPFSDVGGDGTGTRDVSDIFQFLSAWFVGCT